MIASDIALLEFALIEIVVLSAENRLQFGETNANYHHQIWTGLCGSIAWVVVGVFIASGVIFAIYSIKWKKIRLSGGFIQELVA